MLFLFVRFFILGLADVLEPDYHKKAEKLVIFDGRIREPLVLGCKVTTSVEHKLKW